MPVTLKILLPFFLLFLTLSISHSQNKLNHIELKPTSDYSVKTIYYSLGSNKIPIKLTRYGQKEGLVFIALHHNELTSVQAAKKILQSEGGFLIELENKGKRNLRFRIGNYYYTVDPNRIFSKEGIEASMKELGRFSLTASREVEKLGKRLIQLLPENPVCVIALHNNTNDGFSVNEYLNGEKRGKDAAKVNANPDQDPDDFFITTDPYLYQQFILKKYNAVLQDNKNCNQDGSLSVYCGKNSIRYVNLETEHGKYDQYGEMLEYLYEVLTKKDISSKEYYFTSPLSPDTKLPGAGSLIYFGNKKIGKINSIQQSDDNGTITGIMLITNNFPLYSNMSFYFLKDESRINRFEIRIDPTNEKKQLNSPEDMIKLIIKN